MTNRLDDVLAAIDAETAKCICGSPVPADGPSLDYCSLPCQYRWTANLVGTEPAGDTLYGADNEITGGREIVQQVARELAQPVPHGAAEYRSWDSMRQRADQETEPADRSTAQAGPLSVIAGDLAETIRTTMGIPEEWANPRIEPTRAEPEWIPAEADHERAEAALAPDTDGTTRIMFVPNIANPNAPTAAELATGVDLTPFIAPDWVNAMHQVASAGHLSLEEAARNLGAALRTAPEPALTGDELRARALEHRHNRGTGPARRDNRRWRNPR